MFINNMIKGFVMDLPELGKNQKIGILLILFITASTAFIIQNQTDIANENNTSSGPDYLDLQTDEINESNVIIETPSAQYTGKSKPIRVLEESGNSTKDSSTPIKNVNVSVNGSEEKITDNNGSIYHNFSEEGTYNIVAKLKTSNVSVKYNAVDSNSLKLDLRLSNTPVEKGRDLRLVVNKPSTVYYKDGRVITVDSVYAPKNQPENATKINISKEYVNQPIAVRAPNETGTYNITAENRTQDETKTFEVVEKLDEFEVSTEKEGRKMEIGAKDSEGNYISGVSFNVISVDPRIGDVPEGTRSFRFQSSEDNPTNQIELPEGVDEWYILASYGHISEVARVDLSK
jgi:hypothetical protein